MKNIIGPPVYGDNFLFRDKQLKMGLGLLENENSFLMLGIRRTGKSSYLKEMALKIKEKNAANICIEIDCSTYQNVFDFYRGLYEAMPKQMGIRFKKALADSKQLPKKIIDFITDFIEVVSLEQIKINLRDKAITYNKTFENLVINFLKNQENGNVFLFIDELPFFFENISQEDNKIHEVQMLLTSLRNWRHAGIPMGITGSLNLHQQLEHLGLSRKLLAGLNTITLKPFTREESKQLINQLLATKKCGWWTNEVTETLLDLIPDYIPFFIQYAFHTVLVNECNYIAKVEETYHNDIIPGLFKDFIYQFDERLKSFKGKSLNEAMELLDIVAKNNTATLEQLQDASNNNFEYEVLIRLMDYEYLTLSGDQNYNFTLNIIKNWWIQKRNL